MKKSRENGVRKFVQGAKLHLTLAAADALPFREVVEGWPVPSTRKQIVY